MKQAKRSFLLTAVIFLLLFLPTISAGVYFYRNLEGQLLSHVFETRSSLAALSAAAVSLKLHTLSDLALTYASDTGLSSEIASGAWQNGVIRIETLLEDPSHYDYYIERVLLLDPSGAIRGAYPGVRANVLGTKDPAADEWMKAIVQDGAASYVSNVKKNPTGTQNNVIEVTVPVRQSGALAGLVSLVVPINGFSDFGKEINVDSTGFAYIVDGEGRIVTHPRFPSEGSIEDFSHVSSVEDLLKNKSGIGINYNSIESEKRIVAYEKVPGFNWGVVAQQPYQEAMRTRNAILLKLDILIGALSLLELIFAWSVAQIIAKNYAKE